MTDKSFHKTGFTIIQVLVVAGIIGILAAVIAQLGNQMNFLTKRSRNAATMGNFQVQLAPIVKDVPGWLAKLRAAHPPLSSCIPPGSVAVYTCDPAEPGIPSEITTRFPGTIVSLSLPDAAGQPLAGSLSAPVYTDRDGAPCATAQCRSFTIVGFFIRDNASGNPGNVRFAIMVSKIPEPGTTPFKPLVLDIPVGQNWTDLLASCPGGVLAGINPDRSPQCVALSSLCASLGFTWNAASNKCEPTFKITNPPRAIMTSASGTQNYSLGVHKLCALDYVYIDSNHNGMTCSIHASASGNWVLMIDKNNPTDTALGCGSVCID